MSIPQNSEYYFEQLRLKYQHGTLSQDEIIDFENLYKKRIISHYPTYCDFIFNEFEFMPFHYELMKVVDDAINDSVDNQRINIVIAEVPPQHSKTTLLGVGASSYIFGRFPNKTLIYQTYNEDRAVSVAKTLLMPLMQTSKNYRELFPHVRFKMEIDTSKKDLTELYKKKAAIHTERIISNVDYAGKIICAGVDNSITGEPGHFIIYDDFFKGRKDASSAKIRDNVWNSFKSDLVTRIHPDTVFIIFATRWHQDDPIGRLKLMIRDKDKIEDPLLRNLFNRVKIRTFEAIKTARTIGEEFDYDSRAIGQPLWEKFREKYVLHRALDNVDFECMYQANPVSLDEVNLKRENIFYYKSYDDFSIGEVFIGVDLILNYKSRNSKDETAFTVWNRGPDNRIYLLEYYAERVGFRDSKAKLRELCEKYGVAYSASIIEGRTYGYALEEELEDEIYGLIVKEPIGSKKQRFAPCIEMFETGQVMLPHPSICPEITYYIDQLCNFTGDPKDTDDLVDSTSWALNHIKTSTFTMQSNGEIIRGIKKESPRLQDLKVQLPRDIISGNRSLFNHIRGRR